MTDGLPDSVLPKEPIPQSAPYNAEPSMNPPTEITEGEPKQTPPNESSVQVLEARATASESKIEPSLHEKIEITEKSLDLSSQAIASILYEVEPEAPELAELETTVLAKRKSEGLMYSSAELRPIEEITNTLKEQLMSYKGETDADTQKEIIHTILANAHEIDWRHATDDFIAELDPQERDILLTLTRKNSVQKLADIMSSDSLTESCAIAAKEWRLHKHVFQSVTSSEFSQAHPDAPDFVKSGHTSLALKLEQNNLVLQTIGEIARNHPDWTKAALSATWSAFTKYIWPLMSK